ncbi:T3SS effector HopA1 family protein [Dendronalium sp. ChiSLP03b]|uniref:T3SS effector HopA1 family protein n=1 Tax=Dendronalium sp. ChiSLP03b TaxID=3075381 RepID=UPI002AD574DF|nr:T3SS effector HopA1 family protein [Dendronalium sp. ChiSLP03b]MDZ8203760.1 T3SS effector HopA1 family protein [Dendronalium sp. ChiSLP03b]
MQLLDSLSTQLSDIPEPLQTSLQDIVHKVEIQSRYCIKHPDYKALELPESAVSRFLEMPLDLQNKYLSLQLRSFLYGIYYNGSMKLSLAPDAETTNVPLSQNLENNTKLGVDVAFYERLHTSNKGEGYLSRDWLVIKEEMDGILVVEKNGLKLYIERDVHLQPEERVVTVGDSVAIKMPKNLVQSAFYMAVSNAASHGSQNIVRVYFNLTPEGAVAVMESLTTQLNSIGVSFSFKTLYNPSDYGRCDSAVLYFDKYNYVAVHPVLERVYVENQSYFQEQVPLFTKLMAPGLAIAEEPDRKFGDKESFGTHRCQIVANGLIDAWQQGNDTPAVRMSSILQHFSFQEIELQRPYLNANSEDIYTPLHI